MHPPAGSPPRHATIGTTPGPLEPLGQNEAPRGRKQNHWQV